MSDCIDAMYFLKVYNPARSHRVKLHCLLAALLTLYLGCDHHVLSQRKGGRATVPLNKPSETKPTERRKPEASKAKPNRPKSATFLIKVDPPSSSLFLNNQQVEGPAIKGLKPGNYVLMVRHKGYRDEVRSLALQTGENPTIQINLEPLTGTLSISPNVSGADIHVRNIGSDRDLGKYVGQVEGLNLTPGEYEISLTKEGYHRVIRRITIKSDVVIYLEPKLDPVEYRPQTKEPKVVGFVRSVHPLSYSVSTEGKFVIVTIRGASGFSVSLGTIIVSISNSSAGMGNVDGNLNGGPCSVEFVRLENVEEGSFVETPGPTNQWAKLVVRVRPKNPKRPINFAINWKALR